MICSLSASKTEGHLHKTSSQNQHGISMNQPSHHQIATYLTDYALSELVKYVMEDTGCSIEQAMEKVYNSPLMPALQDEEGELYLQSPAYLYELMKVLGEKG